MHFSRSPDVDEWQRFVDCGFRIVVQCHQVLTVHVVGNRQAGECQNGWSEIDVACQRVTAELLAAVLVPRVEHNQRHARGFFVGQNLGTVAVRTAQETIVGRVDDDGVVCEFVFGQRFANAAHRDVDGVDLLVVLRHHFVVLVAVVPTVEPFVLPTLPTLF